MICAFCGRSCGSVMGTRSKWVEVYGQRTRHPICPKCKGAGADKKAASVEHRVTAHRINGTYRYYATCPNPACTQPTSIVLRNLHGICPACHCHVRVSTDKPVASQPDREFTQRKDKELSESRAKNDNPAEKSPLHCAVCDSPNVRACRCKECLAHGPSIYWCRDCGQATFSDGGPSGMSRMDWPKAFEVTWPSNSEIPVIKPGIRYQSTKPSECSACRWWMEPDGFIYHACEEVGKERGLSSEFPRAIDLQEAVDCRRLREETIGAEVE